MTRESEKLLGLLGLARRAGRLAIGFRAVEMLVRREENPVVVFAADIGASQRNKVLGWTPVRSFIGDILTQEEMAQSMGREKLVVVGLSDRGFIKGIGRLGLAETKPGGSRKGTENESRESGE
jgi:hypothetical protein